MSQQCCNVVKLHLKGYVTRDDFSVTERGNVGTINVVTVRNNVATMLQRRVAPKIVVANLKGMLHRAMTTRIFSARQRCNAGTMF